MRLFGIACTLDKYLHSLLGYFPFCRQKDQKLAPLLALLSVSTLVSSQFLTTYLLFAAAC